MDSMQSSDEHFARKLQEEYDREVAAQLQNESVENDKDVANFRDGSNMEKIKASVLTNTSTSSGFLTSDVSPVDPSLEYSDPNPDIRVLFLQFNTQFFWGKLSGIEVKWSPRMTLCAGLCVYEGHGGLCSVRLSLPLLKLRPRKDLVETLLHEMIHAYLFVTHNDRDHDGHGPQFQGHMHRINKATGASISIYHTFHDEVACYQQHWWRCDGPCQNRRPYFGYVKRAMNRAPSPKDFWWAEHQATCGGTYTKIKEPEGYGQKKGGKKEKSEKTKNKDIRGFGGKGHVLGSAASKPSSIRNGNTTNIGSSKNPATIFNISNASQKTMADQLSASSSSATANSGSSIIVNGILQRKPGNVNGSFFSEIQNGATVLSTESDKSTTFTGANNQCNENGKSSVAQQTSRTRNGLDSGDDDDLWISDINNIESLSLSSLLKRKDLKKKTDSVNSDKVKSLSLKSESVNSDKVKSVSLRSESANSDKNKLSNVFKRKRNDVGIFKGRRTPVPLKDRRRKPSVCKDNVFYKEKRKLKKKKYVLDELDSNDDLWNTRGASPLKTAVKTEPSVSPPKAELKERCHIKEEQNGESEINMSSIKSPSYRKGITSYFLSSSGRHVKGDGLAENVLENKKINIKSENQIKVEPKGRYDGNGTLHRAFIDDAVVDLSHFDDDEFDFVSSKNKLLGHSNKSSQNKNSGKMSSSQRGIGSFFTPSGSKLSSRHKSIFSDVKDHICRLDTSTCENENEKEELPDISDNKTKGCSRDKSSIESPLHDDVVDISEEDDDYPSWRLVKHKLSKASTSTVSKSKKTASSEKNIQNYFSTHHSTPSSTRVDKPLNSDEHRSRKHIMKIHDLSDSTGDEMEDFTIESVKSKKRSSHEAFESDENEEEDGYNSNGLPMKVSKQSEFVEDSTGVSTGHECADERPDERDSPESVNKVACPVCCVFVLPADINSHLDLCIQ